MHCHHFSAIVPCHVLSCQLCSEVQQHLMGHSRSATSLTVSVLPWSVLSLSPVSYQVTCEFSRISFVPVIIRGVSSAVII